MILAFLLTICLIMFGIALLALRENSKSATNKLFFLFIIFFDFWIITNYISNSSTDYNISYLTNELVFFSTTFLILFLSFFITVYPKAELKINKSFLIIASVASIIVGIISLSGFIVQNVILQDNYSSINFGNGIYIYVVYFLILLIYSIIVLIRKFRKSKGIEKQKLQYLTLGIILTAILALITNLVLPLIFNSFSLSNLGTGFSLILVSLTGYSIIRHRLLGIRMLLGSLMSVIAIGTFTFAVFYLVLLFENNFLRTPLSADSISINVLISLIFSTVFIILYNAINKSIRKTFIHSSYDSSEELDKFNEIVSKKLKLDEVTNQIITSLKNTLKLNKLSIILFKDGISAISGDYIEDSTIIDFKTFNSFFLITGYSVAIQDEIESLILENKATDLQLLIYNWNKRNEFSALVPLADEEGFKGLIALGKRSILYDTIDISFLNGISRSSNIALGRSSYFKSYTDIIEHLQQLVDEKTKELREKDEEQKNIIDVMGHEIRTPLSVINTTVSLLEEVIIKQKEKWNKKEMNDDDLALLFDSIETVLKSVNQAILLVNDMLETARLDKKKFELIYKNFDLVEIAKTSVELMQKTADKNTTTIQFISKVDKLEVEADETKTIEAIQAIISNAIKYGINPETQKADILVTLTKEDKFAKISIKDNGIGIKDEDIKKLGQKFVRLDPKTPNLQRPNGTGLGLFVVRNIMEYHKGQFVILSDGIGKGSEFILEFPIIKPI